MDGPPHHQTNGDGNMGLDGLEEVNCVWHWESEDTWGALPASWLSYRPKEDPCGYAIVDCGATKSICGVALFMLVRAQIIDAYGEDTEVDYSEQLKITYANNTKGTSMGRGGIPHPVGLTSLGGKLWFALVASASPMLLGLDYLKAAEANVTYDGYLEYSNGHREKLVPLRSGQWGLPIL